MSKLFVLILLLISSSLFAHDLSFLDELNKRDNTAHLSLLHNSPLFAHQTDNTKDRLKEEFFLGQYSQFIAQFNEQYPDYTKADADFQYMYLVAYYYLGNYQKVKEIDQVISKTSLKLVQRQNIQIVEAVISYKEGRYAALEAQYVAIVASGNFATQDLKTLEYLRDALFLKENKQLIFVNNNQYISYILAQNNANTHNYEAALNYYQEAGVPSSDERYVLLQGMKMLASSNYVQALEFFSQLKDEGDYAQEKFFRILEVIFFTRDYSRTLKEIEAFYSKFSVDTSFKVPLSYYEALSYFYTGDYNKAAPLLFTLSPAYPDAYYFHAEIMFGEQRYEQAAKDFKQCLALMPGNSSLYKMVLYGYAWSEFNLGHYAEAKENFNALLKMGISDEPKKFNVILKSADCSFNLHYYKEALKEYNQALSTIEPKRNVYPLLYKDILINLAFIHGKLKQFALANEYLQQYLDIVKSGREYFSASKIMADNYASLELYDKTISIYEQLIANNNKDEDVYIGLADTYYNTKDFAKSLKTYSDYLAKFPQGNRKLDAHYGKVQSLFALKEYDKVLEQAGMTDAEFQTQLVKEFTQKIKFAKEHNSD